MPKVPLPAKTPESISPTLWNGENREDILAFLGDLNAAYLFYKVMKGDPDTESSAIDEANAAKVDKITNLQKAQYLAQADSMFLSETTQTPVKKAPKEIEKQFEGKADENINFYKIPAGVYGHKDLQKGLYMLLRSMAKANYSATIGGVSSTSPECGTKLLTLLNDTISPESKATKDQAKEAYTTHKDTFTNSTNFVPWWTTLLLLQTTKATLGIEPSTRVDALEDACDTIEQKCGHESRWGFEVCRWRLKSDGEKAEKARKGGREMTDEDMVASFENHMRLFQQRRDPRRGPTLSTSSQTTARGASKTKAPSSTTTPKLPVATRSARRVEILAAVEATPRTAAAATPVDPRTTSSKIAP
jgi:hypothetical protein